MAVKPRLGAKRVVVPFDKVKSCQCYAEVERRVRAGVPLKRVARYIHDQGELQDTGTEALEKMLHGLRESLKGMPMSIMHARMDDRAAELMEEAEEALDEIKELTELYKLQRERIDIDVNTERKLKKLFKTTGNEVLIAVRTLQMIAQIKMDTGLVKRELGHVTVDQTLTQNYVEDIGSKVVSDVIQDPQKRAKVLSVMKSLVAAQQKKGVDPLEVPGTDKSGS